MADGGGSGAAAFWAFVGMAATALGGFFVKKWKRDDTREADFLNRTEKGRNEIAKDLRDCEKDRLRLTEERARLQQQVLDSEREKERMRAHGYAANIECNVAGVITAWDHAAEVMFGFSDAEALGENVELIIPFKFRGPHDAALKASNSGHGMLQPDGPARILKTTGLTKAGAMIDVNIELTTHMRLEERRYAARIVYRGKDQVIER